MFNAPKIPDMPDKAVMYVEQAQSLLEGAGFRLGIIDMDKEAAAGENPGQATIRKQARDLISAAIEKLREWKQL